MLICSSLFAESVWTGHICGNRPLAVIIPHLWYCNSHYLDIHSITLEIQLNHFNFLAIELMTFKINCFTACSKSYLAHKPSLTARTSKPLQTAPFQPLTSVTPDFFPVSESLAHVTFLGRGSFTLAGPGSSQSDCTDSMGGTWNLTGHPGCHPSILINKPKEVYLFWFRWRSINRSYVWMCIVFFCM